MIRQLQSEYPVQVYSVSSAACPASIFAQPKSATDAFSLGREDPDERVCGSLRHTLPVDLTR